MKPDLSHLHPTQRLFWNRYLTGEAVPVSQLPTNGQHCPEQTIGGVVCGHPLLIDGSCTNAYMHGQPDRDITDDMLDAALAEFPDELVHTVAPFIAQAIEAALRAREDDPS